MAGAHSFTGVYSVAADDEKLEELRPKINPQSGADGAAVVVDVVTTAVDGTVTADTRSAAGIETGRPQPPPAVPVIFVDTTSLFLGVCCRFALSLRIGSKVSVFLRYAEQEYPVLCVFPPVCVVALVFVRCQGNCRDPRLFRRVEGFIQKHDIQPCPQAAGLPRYIFRGQIVG